MPENCCIRSKDVLIIDKDFLIRVKEILIMVKCEIRKRPNEGVLS